MARESWTSLESCKPEEQTVLVSGALRVVILLVFVRSKLFRTGIIVQAIICISIVKNAVAREPLEEITIGEARCSSVSLYLTEPRSLKFAPIFKSVFMHLAQIFWLMTQARYL